MTPVEAVGNVAGGKQEKQPRQKERQSRIAKVESPMGNGVDLPRHSDRLRLRTQDGGNARNWYRRKSREAKASMPRRGGLVEGESISCLG